MGWSETLDIVLNPAKGIINRCLFFTCDPVRVRRILRQCGRGSGMMTGALEQARKTPTSAGTARIIGVAQVPGSGPIPHFWRLLQ